MTNRRDDRYNQDDRRYADERHLMSNDRNPMGMGRDDRYGNGDNLGYGRSGGMDMYQGGAGGRDDMRDRYDDRSMGGMRGGMGVSGHEAYGYGRDDRNMGNDSMHGGGMYQRNTGYRDDRSMSYGQTNMGMGTDRDMNPSRMSGRMGGGGGYSSHDGFYAGLGDNRQMGMGGNARDDRQMGMGGMSGGMGSGMGGMSGGMGGMSSGGMGGGMSHRGKGPKGYQRSDDRIREMVSDALEDDDHIDASEIEVMVQNGEVTLTGTVSDRQQKRWAEDCAERVRGVRDVHNQIRVQQSGMGQGSMGSGIGMGGSSGMRSDSGESESTGVTAGVGTTPEASTITATTSGSNMGGGHRS